MYYARSSRSDALDNHKWYIARRAAGKVFPNSRLTKSQDLKFVDAIIKKYYGGDQGEHARKRTANKKHNLWPN